MWPFKKKKVPVQAPPAPPTEWIAVTEIKVVNNVTDKEYIFKADNDYGLRWEYFHDARRLNIRQKMNHDGTAWNAVAHLDNFSIISITRKPFKASKTQ